MNKLIIPDVEPNLLDLEPYNKCVEEIYARLKTRHPDWIELDEALSLDIMLKNTILISLVGKTFIIPEKLVRARRYLTSLNRLISNMFSVARHYSWNFIVIGPSLESLDVRIRDYITGVEIWDGSTE